MFLLYPTVFYCIQKFLKRENCARKRAALLNSEQTHPRSKKMGVFPNGPKLNYPSAAVVRHYGTGQRTLAMLHF